MLVLDYDLICAHILLPFVRDTRPQTLLSHFTLDTIHLYTILFYAVEWSGKSVGWVCAAGGQEDLGLGVWDWRLKGQQLERWHSHWNEKGQSGWKFNAGQGFRCFLVIEIFPISFANLLKIVHISPQIDIISPAAPSLNASLFRQ